MSTNSLSYVTMPSVEVERLAQACLDRISKRRSREDDAYVANERKRHERSWWRRLTGGKIPTDDQIRESLSIEWPFYQSCYAWGSKAVAEKLLRLAKRADVVHVTADDLDMIA